MFPTSNEHITLFLAIISVVGTIGNLIVATVYYKKKDKQTSTFFILVLAFIDLTVCCILVPLTIYMESILFETSSLILCKAFFFLTTTTVPSSSLMMTAIAIDRYFCICQATNKNILTLQKTKLIGLILLMISGLLGVIPALGSIIQTTTTTSTNSTNSNITESYDLIYSNNSSASSFSSISYQCMVNHDSNSTIGFLIMPFKFFYDLIFVVSVITITSLYVLIYKEIYTRRKAKRDRRRELLNNKFLNGGGGEAYTGAGGGCRICFCFSSEIVNNQNVDIVVVEMHNDYKNNNNNNNNNNLIPLLKRNSCMSNNYNNNNNHEEKNIKFNLEENQEETPVLDEKAGTERKVSLAKLSINPNMTKNNSNKQTGSSSTLRQSLRRRSLSYGKHVISTKDIRTAFMLFVVSFLFIIFYLPSLMATYVSLFIPNLPANLYIAYLYFSNSAINPMIYCFLNPNFRNDLIKIFFKRGFLVRNCTNK